MLVCTHTHTHTYIFTMKYYSVMRKEAILPPPTTWIDLKHVMLSEVSQREETQVLYDNLHVESK